MVVLFYIFLIPISILLGSEINQKVILCGVCRNVETRLPRMQNIMESVGLLFEDYQIIVYENNSNDNTLDILISWAKTNSKVKIKSDYLSQTECESYFINIHEDGSFFVPEQIARARNIVLEEALSETYQEYPYIIWMDMDFVIPPDLEGFLDTFSKDEEWDAVFAYGIDPNNSFWDWYAFRDKIYPIGSELLGMDWWYMPKYFSLKQGDPWYPVYSAFGGCGIYKKASIQNCRYSAYVTRDLETHAKDLIQAETKNNHPQILKLLRLNEEIEHTSIIQKPQPHLPKIRDPMIGILLQEHSDALKWRMSSFVYQYPSVCEHVPFHASMIVQGHSKLYINPKLVFYYGDL